MSSKANTLNLTEFYFEKYLYSHILLNNLHTLLNTSVLFITISVKDIKTALNHLIT